GHVLDRARLGTPFAMRPALLRGEGGRLVDASNEAGPWFTRAALGRGLAVPEPDRPRRPHLAVHVLDPPPAVLRHASADPTAAAARTSWSICSTLPRRSCGMSRRARPG